MRLRLLADENFPRPAVEALRQRGHDVLWVRTHAPGASDTEVLALACREGRLLVTFDTDFGELAVRFGLPAAAGVVLFRISAPSREHVALATTAALESRGDWAGHFSVVTDDRVRMRPLPPAR